MLLCAGRDYWFGKPMVIFTYYGRIDHLRLITDEDKLK